MYDCIIVGAGPAGSTAAYHLAKRGRSVLLLEKQALPREKPCGGGVSPQVAGWFDFDFSPVISAKVDTVRCTWKMGDAVEATLHTKPMWMVRRNEFDRFIAQKAQEQGATLYDSTPVRGIEFKGDRWFVTTPRGVFEGQYAIAADGSKGPMADWLGFRNRRRTMCGAIEVEPRATMSHTNVAHFEFGLVKNGYAWNFPKADGHSIGSGAFRPSREKVENIAAPLVDYAAQFQVDFNTCHRQGHPLFLWNGTQTLHTQNALLAGEAACVVDPFTAEGIRPSIFSGLKASEAIDGALAGDLEALERYTQTINEEWGADMAWAKRLAEAFYRFPFVAYKFGVKLPHAFDRIVPTIYGEVRYADIVERALKRISFGLAS